MRGGQTQTKRSLKARRFPHVQMVEAFLQGLGTDYGTLSPSEGDYFYVCRYRSAAGHPISVMPDQGSPPQAAPQSASDMSYAPDGHDDGPGPTPLAGRQADRRRGRVVSVGSPRAPPRRERLFPREFCCFRRIIDITTARHSVRTVRAGCARCNVDITIAPFTAGAKSSTLDTRSRCVAK